MIAIQRPVWRRALLLLLGASIVIGIALHGIVGIFVDLDGIRPLAIALGSLVGFAAFAGGLTLYYRPFAVDPASRTARVGGRTVPIESFREATRSISAAANGAAYLVYTFRSTEGPVARVLVVGRPLPGLDPAGVEALARFLELAPIAGPARASADDLASNVVGDGKKVPASAAALLAEIRPAEGVPAGETVAAPASVPVDAGAQAAREADDLAAFDALLVTLPLARLRRRVGLAFAGSVALALLGILLAVIVEATGSRPDPGLVGIIGIVIGLLLVGTAVGWAVLGDRHTREVRRISQRWIEDADTATRARGLPEPFHGAWLQFAPGHRLLTGLAFTAAVLGGMATLMGIAGPFFGEVALVFGLIPGVPLLAFAIWFWMRHRRRRRADVAWVIEAAGPRAH